MNDGLEPYVFSQWKQDDSPFNCVCVRTENVHWKLSEYLPTEQITTIQIVGGDSSQTPLDDLRVASLPVVLVCQTGLSDSLGF